jgi:hypothetical protein
MNDDDFDSVEIPPDIPAEDEPYWTTWRIIYLVVALLVITALLAAMLWPLLLQLAEYLNPPPLPPRPRELT